MVRNTHSLSHTADCSLTGTIGSIVGVGKEKLGRPLGVWLLLVCVCVRVCVDMGDNSATCPELPSFHWERCEREGKAVTHTHTHRKHTHIQTQHRYHTEPYADPSLSAAISANQLLEGMSHTHTHIHTHTHTHANNSANPESEIYTHIYTSNINTLTYTRLNGVMIYI